MLVCLLASLFLGFFEVVSPCIVEVLQRVVTLHHGIVMLREGWAHTLTWFAESSSQHQHLFYGQRRSCAWHVL